VKRSAALAGLSRDHHEALAVALRLRRAEPATAQEARERFTEYFDSRGSRHFDMEETVLGPEIRQLPDGAELYRRLLDEHTHLRALGARVVADEATTDTMHRLGEELTAHVRFEERELFPLLERELDEARLAELGELLHA
jgi:hemerythrin-like domain-containing protein